MRFDGSRAGRRAVTALAMLLLAGTGVAAKDYREAPMLAKLVESGALPPVAQRLPPEPMVVPVVERIGDYGGTWHEYISGPSEAYKLQRAGAYETLFRWNADFTDVEPNIVEAADVANDGRQYTFRLRKGIRWSDGAPFSADDILFAINDVLGNRELSPGGLPSWLTMGGEAPLVEKIDDYTIRFTFAEPQGMFTQRLADRRSQPLTQFPKHHLQKFHADYNPDGINALVAAAGASNWPSLFQREQWIDEFGSNPNVPVLYPWVVKVPFGGNANRMLLERNPYYWKVDPEGNQLPYIDQQAFHIIENVELSAIAKMSGELDSLMLRDDAASVLANKAVFMDSMEQGGYRFVGYDLPGVFRVVAVNLVHKDPTMRAILGNKDFRIGLSLAINREEIIELLHYGLGEPFQAAPAHGSRYYDEEYAKQYTAFDIDLANEYLDRVLPEKDAEGYRLLPSGERFVLNFIMLNRPDDTNLFEILLKHWAAVGLKVTMNPMDRSLRNTRLDAADFDGFTFGGSAGAKGDELLNPRWYMPVEQESRWALPWAEWFMSNGSAGEEPPPQVRHQLELYREVTRTFDPARRDELARQIFQISKEQFYVIGVVTQRGDYAVIDNNLRNVPEVLHVGPAALSVAVANPAQFFFEGGRN